MAIGRGGGAGGRPGGAPGVVRRAHGGGGRGRVAVLRHDPARGGDEVAGAAAQRSEDASVAEDVAQSASGGAGRGWRVAVPRRQGGDARHAARRSDLAAAREPLHESLPEGLPSPGARPALRGAARELRGRLRSPVSLRGGGGARAESPVVRPDGPDAQRAEDPGVRWAARVVYVPGLHLWADALPEGWALVLGSRACPEGGEADQGTHPADPSSDQPRALGRGRGGPQSCAAWLGATSPTARGSWRIGRSITTSGNEHGTFCGGGTRSRREGRGASPRT